MRHLLLSSLLFLTISLSLKAQTSDATIEAMATIIGGETTTGANTKTRVMNALKAINSGKVSRLDPILMSPGAVNLVAPGADRILFWDQSTNSVTWLQVGANLSITGTTINGTGGGGGGVSDGNKGDVTVWGTGSIWANNTMWKGIARLKTTAALSANSYTTTLDGNGRITSTDGGFNPADLVVDGTTPSIGDFVIVSEESTTFHNGAYVVTSNGTLPLIPWQLERRSDSRSPEQLNKATYFVYDGSVNANKYFQQSIIQFGSLSNITFTEWQPLLGGQVNTFSGPTSFLLNGNQWNVGAASTDVLSGNWYVHNWNIFGYNTGTRFRIFEGSSFTDNQISMDAGNYENRVVVGDLEGAGVGVKIVTGAVDRLTIDDLGAMALLPGGDPGDVLTTDGTYATWGPSVGGAWGTILGTLSSQTDLQSALDTKQNTVADPNANKVLAWDDTDNSVGYWALGTGLTYNHGTHTMSSSLVGLTDGDKGDITVSGSGTAWAVDNSAITYAKIQNGTGLSLLGRSANSGGVNADITGAADQVFRVNGAGTAVGAGSIDLNKSATVGSTILKAINGGTDQSGYVVGDVLTANTTTTLSKVTAGASGSFLQYAGAGVVPSASALKLPTSATVNQIVYASALNTWAGSPNFIYDGTRLALNATVTNNNAFGITMPVTLTADDNAIMKIGGAGSTTTLRNTSGDKFYTFSSAGTIVTAATNQTIRWLQQTAAYTTNHTGARIDGLYFAPTFPGSQTPVINHVLESGSLVMGALTAATNALVDIRSTTKGVQFPAMTQTQRDAITGSDGLVIANTTTHRIDYHNGTSWGPIADGEAQVTISTAAILTGNSVPVQLLAAPGAGKLIVVTSSIVCKFKYGSAVFATVPTYRFYYGPGTSSFTSGTNTSSSLTQTNDNIIFVNTIENSSAATTLENAGIYFKVDTSDPTGGTGSTLVVYFKYKVITL